MRNEQHWYRQLDGNPQHKTYVSTTPLPGVLDTINQVSQVSIYRVYYKCKEIYEASSALSYFTKRDPVIHRSIRIADSYLEQKLWHLIAV
jgi:hypothetical protein